MKILIEMSLENYDLLLSKLAQESYTQAILKNGIVVNKSCAGRIINLACEVSDAASLLRIAQQRCPEVAPQLKNEIKLMRPFIS